MAVAHRRIVDIGGTFPAKTSVEEEKEERPGRHKNDDEASVKYLAGVDQLLPARPKDNAKHRCLVLRVEISALTLLSYTPTSSETREKDPPKPAKFSFVSASGAKSNEDQEPLHSINRNPQSRKHQKARTSRARQPKVRKKHSGAKRFRGFGRGKRKILGHESGERL